jgi:hypothetical protein
MRAVVDRFEGDYAVLLIEDDEIKVDFPRKLLPDGTREGSWLTVDLKLDQEKTKKQEEKIAKLLDKLKKKNKEKYPQKLLL